MTIIRKYVKNAEEGNNTLLAGKEISASTM